MRSCKKCGAIAPKLDKCGKCRAAYYCNAACQKADWADHKGVCREYEPPKLKYPKPTHFQHKIKCIVCCLHFIILSFDAAWTDQPNRKVHCPECGNTNTMRMLFWSPEPNSKNIFEVVPGTTGFKGAVPNNM